MKTVHTLFAKSILLSVIIWMGSCTSTQKLIHQGRYNAAISKLRKKLLKKNQKQKHILALEEAFKKATDRDMNDVLAKLESNKIHDLEDVLGIAYGIQNRQAKVETLLPLASNKSGYIASFQFVKIGEIIDKLEQKLVERYIEEGKLLLASGRSGNKSSARAAYDYFSKAKRIADHPVILQYLDSAYYHGKTRVLVDITNVSGDWIGHYLEDYMHLDVRSMNSFWTEYFLDPGEENMDYKAEAVIQSIDISPEHLNERTYQDRREIEDGFEYVLDQNGNVLKDSLGNDVKILRKIWVTADIIELLQQKDLYIRGALDIFDAEGVIVESRPFEVIEEFEHYSSTFRGDRRALSSESRRKIGDRPISFPDDQHMIIEAIKKLSPAIHDQLRSRRWSI